MHGLYLETIITLGTCTLLSRLSTANISQVLLLLFLSVLFVFCFSVVVFVTRIFWVFIVPKVSRDIDFFFLFFFSLLT